MTETLPAAVSDIDPGEAITLFPTYGRLGNDGQQWEIPLRGMIHEPGPDSARRRLLVNLFRRIVRVGPDHPNNTLFERRLEGFLHTHEKGKRVVLQIGDEPCPVQHKTKRNGQFRGMLTLTQQKLAELKERGDFDNGWLRMRVAQPDHATETTWGRAQMIERVGVSIISDIDDTMKHTDVSSRRELLANTFLRDFQAVPGASEIFQQWAGEGAVFHYVSSSPWQLFHPLAEFCAQHAYPQGTFHLKSLRFRDPSALQLFIAKRRGKKKSIKALLHAFPFRKFLLVGDSGEKDPELYGSMARKHPGQVVGIFIRDLKHRPVDRARRERAFRELPQGLWKLYRHSEELPREIPLLTKPTPGAADWPTTG